MTPQEFTRLRKSIGKSQSSLAKLLGISIRSVQAYEQGWREVHPQVHRMALYLLYQKRRGQRPMDRCWELKNCPTQWRDQCPVWEFQAQGPCWFVSRNLCEGRNVAWDEKMETCSVCPVFTCFMESEEETTNG